MRTALWCVLKAGGAFRESVLRGTNSSGHSDSIACIAGSISGALVGLSGVPTGWVARVEKSAMLDGLARALHRARTGGDEPAPELDPFGAEAQPAEPEEADDEMDEDIGRDE